MSEESKSSLPTSLTPYALGAGVLVLIAVFSLMASVPWANKNEIALMKDYIKNEIEWLKQQQASTQKQVDSIDFDRRERGGIISELKSKVSDFERRLQRLEDVRNRQVPP